MSDLLRRSRLRAWRPGRCSLLVRPLTLSLTVILLLAALVLLIAGLTHGSLTIPTATLARALFQPEVLTPQQQYVVQALRLPRMLMALLVGAMLGMAGAVMQSVSRNGLADPGLLGIKEGAGLVVLTQLLLFPQLSLLWRPLSAVCGALLVTLLVILLARDLSRPRFILIGIGISWGLSAASGLFITTVDPAQVQTVLLWLAGSLNSINSSQLLVVFCCALPVIILLLLSARSADVLQLGNAAASGLGVRLKSVTLLQILLAAILTAVAVSCAGSIGFIGLMAPHLSRMLVRGGQSTLLLGSALCGAVMVLLADNLGRLLFAPLQLPAGIVISLLGAPFFLWLLWQRRDTF